MNEICKMQALNSIFAAIKKVALSSGSEMVIAELASCGEAILYAPDDEALAAWKMAQECICKGVL